MAYLFDAMHESDQTKSDPAMLGAILDPTALAILERLGDGPATSAEIADALGLEVDAIRKALRGLRRDRQVIVRGRSRRGAQTENVYAPDLRATVIEEAELAGAPGQAAAEARLILLRTMFREVDAAIESGSFSRRDDGAQIRFPMPLDEGGFREASEIHRRLLADTVATVERASARLTQGGARPIPASIFVLFLEFPADRWPRRLSRSEPARRRGVADRIELALDLTDPVRNRLLDALLVAPASVADLSARLKVPAPKVRYEIERLLAGGLITVVERRAVRGAVERTFVAEPTARILSAEDHAGYAGDAADGFGRWMATTLFQEALETIGSDEMTHPLLARISTGLDAEGFKEISGLAARSVDELLPLRDRALEALGKGERRSRLALSGTFLFER